MPNNALIYEKETLLPQVIDCPYCKTSLKLSKAERLPGERIECPSCSRNFKCKIDPNTTNKSIPLWLIAAIIMFLLGVSSGRGSISNSNESDVIGVKTLISTVPTMQVSKPAISPILANPAPTTIEVISTENPTTTSNPKTAVIPVIISTPKATVKPTTVSTPIATAKPTAKPTSPPAPKYTCSIGCSKTCGQMSSCAEAYYELNTCGCGKRDGDNDGIPCESICR